MRIAIVHDLHYFRDVTFALRCRESPLASKKPRGGFSSTETRTSHNN